MANKNNNKKSRLKTWFGKIQEKKRIIVLDVDNYEEKDHILPQSSIYSYYRPSVLLF